MKRDDETLEEFRQRLGIPYSTFVRWSKGTVPRRGYVALAEKLDDCTPGWLTYGHEAVAPPPERLKEVDEACQNQVFSGS